MRTLLFVLVLTAALAAVAGFGLYLGAWTAAARVLFFVLAGALAMTTVALATRDAETAA
jgi:hypothetical protein